MPRRALILYFAAVLASLALATAARPATAERIPAHIHVTAGVAGVGYSQRDGDAVDSLRHLDLGGGFALSALPTLTFGEHVAAHGLVFFDLVTVAGEDAPELGHDEGGGAGVTLLGTSWRASTSVWIGRSVAGEDDTGWAMVGYELRAGWRWSPTSGIDLAFRDGVNIVDYGILRTRSLTLGYSASLR